MSKLLFVICLTFLSISPVYARNRGGDFFRHWDFDREVSDFNRIREREFKHAEDREFNRVWISFQGAELIFIHTPHYEDSSRYLAYKYSHQGTDALHQGNFTQAVVEFTKAIQICPDLASAYYFRAIAYNRLREYDNALADLDKAQQLGFAVSAKFIDMINQEKSHQGAMAIFQLGLNEMHLNNDIQAIAEYSKAIQAYPGMTEAYYCRGIAYYKIKDYSKALADVNKAGQLGFPVKPDLVIVIKDSGNLPQIIDDLTKAIYINPDDERLYFRRGLCYKKKLNYAQAIADETRAIEINPNYGNAYRTRGACEFFEKEYTQSWADMMKAQQLGIHLNPVIMDKLRQELGR